MKKILSPAYSLKLKSFIFFLNQGLIFFQIVIFATLFRRCPTLWKSMLKMTLSNVVQFNFEIHNVVSTLLNVVNFNSEVHNVVPTLIWRCATSRPHINCKTTLSRRWNVCWKRFKLWIKMCSIHTERKIVKKGFQKSILLRNLKTRSQVLVALKCY